LQADGDELGVDRARRFRSPLDCFRELLILSLGSGAASVTIKLLDLDERCFQALVCDDGHGMDAMRLSRLLDGLRHATRAVSDAELGPESRLVLGSFRRPGRGGLTAMTSSGREAWCARLSAPLARDPVELRKVWPAPTAGTRVLLQFDKREPLEALAERARALVSRDGCLLLSVEVYSRGR
jgi:hypothetical protein